MRSVNTMNMFQGVSWAELDRLGVVGMLIIGAIGVITGRIYWYTTVRKIEADRDYWRDTALDLLGVTQKLTVQSEVTNDILSKGSQVGAPPTRADSGETL